MHCKEVGFDCDGGVRAGSEEEVLHMAAEHARIVHGVTALTSEWLKR
jgi:predicted small metal-binding protein